MSATGVISVGTYRFSVGAPLRGTTLTVIRTHNRAVVYDCHGEPLGHVMLTPDKKYTTLITA